MYDIESALRRRAMAERLEALTRARTRGAPGGRGSDVQSTPRHLADTPAEGDGQRDEAAPARADDVPALGPVDPTVPAPSRNKVINRERLLEILLTRTNPGEHTAAGAAPSTTTSAAAPPALPVPPPSATGLDPPARLEQPRAPRPGQAPIQRWVRAQRSSGHLPESAASAIADLLRHGDAGMFFGARPKTTNGSTTNGSVSTSRVINGRQEDDLTEQEPA